MKTTTVEEVEVKLFKAIEKTVKAGGFLNDGTVVGVNHDGSFRSDYYQEGSVCLLGSVLFGHKRKGEDGHVVEAARILGITDCQARSLERGYLGGGNEDEWAELGRKIKDEYFYSHGR